MGGDFGAVYVRLMQGALIAQLSKDILGEAPPAAAPAGGGGPEQPPAGFPERSGDRRPAENAPFAHPRTAAPAAAQSSLPVASSAVAATPPGAPTSDVVPDQLEPAMRAAADERPAGAAATDTVQRLRMATAASLTLAGLQRTLSSPGERAEPPQSTAAAPADPQGSGEAAAPSWQQPTRPAGLPGALLAGTVGRQGGADAGGADAGDGSVPFEPRRAVPSGGPFAAGAAATLLAGQQAQAADGVPVLRAALAGDGVPAETASGTAAAATAMRGIAGEGTGRMQPADAMAAARAPAVLSLADAEAYLSPATAVGAADGIDAIRTSAIGGPLLAGGIPAVAGETFLAALAAVGNRPDQAVSRDMLAAVILNAAMIPGWPFPRAFENPAHAADARRAAARIAAAGAEEFKLTPEEMIAYLTSIGANARLLKALQDLFARVEKKEAVQLMAWLMALTSALREVEKSVEDLLRKGTRLPEWADEIADQIRKSLSRRHRLQI